MNVKRILSALLASTMVVSMMAACGTAKPTDQTGDTPAATDPDTKTEEPAQAETPKNDGGMVAMADAGDPITYNVFVRDPGTAPAKDNEVIKKVQELTGVTMQYEFLVGELDQKLGVMIAGGDYPDAIFAGDAGAKLIDAGAFIPLEDRLPKYANLSKLYEKAMPTMKAEDGHTYGLELYNGRGTDPIFENGGSGFFIQKAVLEEFNYPIPKTVDEYFDLIQKYKEKYPEIDGVKTIGFEVLSDGWRNFCLTNPPQHLLGAGNDGALFVDPESFETSYYQTTDSTKAYYKKLNAMYKEGIIEAETFTQDYDQYISRLSTGAVLGTFDQYWNFSNADNLLKNDGKYERTYVAVPIANEGVSDGYLDAPSANVTGNNGIGITVNCENPDRLLNYFDWFAQREVQDYIQWGEEGKDYTVTENGGKVLTAERRAVINDVAKKRDLTGNTLWQYSPQYIGLYDDGQPCGPGNSEDEFLAKQSEYDKKFLGAYKIKYPAELLSDPVKRPMYYPLWAMTIEDGSAAAVTKTKIGDISAKYYPQLVLAKDDAEYDAIWAKYVAEFEACDLDALKTEYDRQIALKQGS